MSRKPPRVQIEEGAQMGLLQPQPIRQHAHRCVCGAPLWWIESIHGAPFDGGLRAARLALPEEEAGARLGYQMADGARGLRRVVLGGKAGEPSAVNADRSLRLWIVLHACPRWNGSVVALTAKERKEEP